MRKREREREIKKKTKKGLIGKRQASARSQELAFVTAVAALVAHLGSFELHAALHSPVFHFGLGLQRIAEVRSINP